MTLARYSRASAAEAERVEYRLHLALVEILEIVADRGIREQFARQSFRVGAPRRPALGETGMAEVEDEELQPVIALRDRR